MDLRTDQMLASAFVAGDVNAFAALYDRHAPGVYAGACALLGPTNAASSTVATVFQRLARDITRRKRVAAAPIVHLDRLTRREVRRRLRWRGLVPVRRATDGLDRTLPPKLRVSVLGLVTAPGRRPAQPIVFRMLLGVAAIGAAVGIVTGGAWLGRSILDRSEASEDTFPPVNPTLLSPIATSPPTSEVAALPPVPVDPAAPVVDPAAPAAAVQLSTSVVDFGAAGDDGSVTLRNTGENVELWNIEGDPAPFTMLAVPGALAPGQEATILFSLDRSTVPEGSYEVTLNLVGSTPQPIVLRAATNSAPLVTIMRTTPSLVFACDGGSIEVAATIADDSPVSNVTISWIGPGLAGQATMNPNSSEWIGTITPDPVPGNWAYAIQAVDDRGNPGSAVGTFQVSAC